MATYTVKPNDTLGEIATKLGVDDWRDLYIGDTLAGETDPNKLGIGAVITTQPPGTVDPDAPITGEATFFESGDRTAPDDPLAPQGFKAGADTEAGDKAAGVLAGGRLVRMPPTTEGGVSSWYQVYEYPKGSGSYLGWQFTSEEEVLAVFDAQDLAEVSATVGIAKPEWLGLSRESIDTGQLRVVDTAGEIVGVEGGFDNLIAEAQAEAVRRAGIVDPSLTGRVASDPQIGLILTAAALGEMSNEEVLGAVRDTNFWKNELYPGIEFFYARGDQEPEQAWEQYRKDVSSNLNLLGIPQDPDGSYRTAIGDMLERGIGEDALDRFTPVFQEATSNPAYFEAFNAWADRLGVGAVEFGDWFDVLDGNSTPELDAVVEASGLQFQADAAGLALTAEQITDIAEATNLTPQQALTAFTEADKALLSIGEQDLAGFGVTKQDFIDVAVQRAPSSGRSRAEVLNLQQQIATERGLSDEASARFFIGFSRAGTQTRRGLEPLAGEGG